MKLITTTALLIGLAVNIAAASTQKTPKTAKVVSKITATNKVEQVVIRTTNKTEIIEQTISGGIPVYKVIMIPTTNTAPTAAIADNHSTWISAGAPPVSLTDIPGYRQPVGWYTPLSQDAPYNAAAWAAAARQKTYNRQYYGQDHGRYGYSYGNGYSYDYNYSTGFGNYYYTAYGAPYRQRVYTHFSQVRLSRPPHCRR